MKNNVPGWTPPVTFKVDSGRLIVTDPCYTQGTWCSGLLTDVRQGVWEATALIVDSGDWGGRVAKLMVRHQEHDDLSEPQELCGFEVGVDSGQAGFFDFHIYPQGDETGDYGDLSTFYGRACYATLGDDRNEHSQCGGVVDGHGVATRSGFGDGGYDCYARRDNGEVVAAMIVFIADEELDEDVE